MNHARSLRIGWKVETLASNRASVRYRAMLPFLGLEADGHSCHVFSDIGSVDLKNLDVLVVVKSFNSDTYLLMKKAAISGIPVLMDLCDNIFTDHYGGRTNDSKDSAASMFALMSDYASAIIVSTEPLLNAVKSNLKKDIPIFIIPDGAETPELQKIIISKLNEAEKKEDKIFIFKCLNFLKKTLRFFKVFKTDSLLLLSEKIKIRIHSQKSKNFQNAKTSYSEPLSTFNKSKKYAIWFGSHGASYGNFGMIDLLRIKSDLEQAGRELQMSLVVVSNNYEKYLNYIKDFDLQTYYVSWSPEKLSFLLEHASVAVIPNSLDTFSACKSANRSILALNSGTPVVATSTTALAPLSDCIILDDFLGGLRTYLKDGTRAKRDIEKALNIIDKEFGLAVITNGWKKVLSSVVKT